MRSFRPELGMSLLHADSSHTPWQTASYPPCLSRAPRVPRSCLNDGVARRAPTPRTTFCENLVPLHTGRRGRRLGPARRPPALGGEMPFRQTKQQNNRMALRLSASRPSLEAPCQDLATLDGVETVSSVLPLLQSSAALQLVPAQTNDDAIS